tara:strand:- start:231 stop:668 length:438 start_codon:yes stop_codon:yes gene_type:complete
MNKNPPKTNWAETIFSRKWGILAIDLAAQDGVTPDAIHMRVLNFGNPFQRKAKPSKWEELYSKSLCELATELGMHPMSIAQRHQKLGNVYLKPVNLSREPNRRWVAESRWRDITWLHPKHPDYTAWRSGEMYAKSISKPENFITY